MKFGCYIGRWVMWSLISLFTRKNPKQFFNVLLPYFTSLYADVIILFQWVFHIIKVNLGKCVLLETRIRIYHCHSKATLKLGNEALVWKIRGTRWLKHHMRFWIWGSHSFDYEEISLQHVMPSGSGVCGLYWLLRH